MLKKENRLKKKKEFNFIYKKGEIIHSTSFTIHFVKAYRNIPKIGISVSKKVGNSVIRSRVKRIISEAARLNVDRFVVKHYVITAKESAKDKLSTDIEKELIKVMTKAKLIKDILL